MSRIDEALRRVSLGPYARRGPTQRDDGALLLAEDCTLDEYPREGRASAQKDVAIAQTTPMAREPGSRNAPSQPAQPRSRAFVNPALNDKLVVGATCDVVSTEQYR